MHGIFLVYFGKNKQYLKNLVAVLIFFDVDFWVQKSGHSYKCCLKVAYNHHIDIVRMHDFNHIWRTRLKVQI